VLYKYYDLGQVLLKLQASSIPLYLEMLTLISPERLVEIYWKSLEAVVAPGSPKVILRLRHRFVIFR